MTVRIKIYRRGVTALLKAPEVVDDLEQRARRIAAAAGPGQWNVHAEKGRRRARAAVVTGDLEARRNEAKTRALTRAIDAGRT